MNWFTALATFIILWFLALFIVLPIGVRGQAEENDVVEGSEPGAPVAPMLGKKALWATGLAAIFFIIVYLVVTFSLITWDDLGRLFGLRD